MSSRSLDGVVAKIDASSSNLNLYKSFTKQDRINLNSTSCSNNASGSCNELYRDFNQGEFQSFDYGRFTKYEIKNRQECIRDCYENPDQFESVGQCIRACETETRTDYV
jgi:hypothetical protein